MTTVALIYDFDGTLTPGNMQEHRFIPDIGLDVSAFWNEVENTAITKNMDPTLAYMYVMLESSKRAGISVFREDLVSKGNEIKYFPGVENWFDRITDYGLTKGIDIEHYVISSGNGEIIEGSSIASKFKKIYASQYLYDDTGVAVWPSVAINFTTKTQYLFRINKNVHDIFDRSLVNKYVPQKDRAIPFKQMVYLGDGETDIPCFRLLKDMGGLSIAVYDEGKKREAEKFIEDGRVNYIALADYTDGSDIDVAIKSYINWIAIMGGV